MHARPTEGSKGAIGLPGRETWPLVGFFQLWGTTFNSWWSSIPGYARSGCCLPFQPHCWSLSTWLPTLQPTGVFKEQSPSSLLFHSLCTCPTPWLNLLIIGSQLACILSKRSQGPNETAPLSKSYQSTQSHFITLPSLFSIQNSLKWSVLLHCLLGLCPSPSSSIQAQACRDLVCLDHCCMSSGVRVQGMFGYNVTWGSILHGSLYSKNKKWPLRRKPHLIV